MPAGSTHSPWSPSLAASAASPRFAGCSPCPRRSSTAPPAAAALGSLVATPNATCLAPRRHRSPPGNHRSLPGNHHACTPPRGARTHDRPPPPPSPRNGAGASRHDALRRSTFRALAALPACAAPEPALENVLPLCLHRLRQLQRFQRHKFPESSSAGLSPFFSRRCTSRRDCARTRAPRATTLACRHLQRKSSSRCHTRRASASSAHAGSTDGPPASPTSSRRGSAPRCFHRRRHRRHRLVRAPPAARYLHRYVRVPRPTAVSPLPPLVVLASQAAPPSPPTPQPSQPLPRSRRCATSPNCDVMWIGRTPTTSPLPSPPPSPLPRKPKGWMPLKGQMPERASARAS